MTNKILAALACLGLAANAGAAEVNFDQGIDVKSVIEQAKNSDVKAPYAYYGPQRVRYSRECKNFSFASSGFAQASERAYLSSTEYIEECRFIPNPPPPPVVPPNNGGQPGHPGGPGGDHGGQPGGHPGGPGGDHGGHPGGPGGHPGGFPGHQKDFNDHGNGFGPHGEYSYPGNQHGQQGTYYCHERIGQVYRATAQVNIAPRQLFPWESEAFEVCMEANRVDFNTRTSPYSYNVDRQGIMDLTFNLTPNYRVPTAPDANGINLTSWSYKDGKFVLSLNDRWAEYYAGEKVAVKVELVKDGFLFFNSSLGEKEFTVDAAGNYELSFVEGDLTKTKAFVDTSGDVRGPKKFFAKWGFRRIGSVSNGDYIKKGDTEKITQ